MSVLKNKRRTSKIEYERNFIGLYEYMMNLIDHMPKRYMQVLGKPMKDRLNEMYDKVMKISDMYIEKEPWKERYLLCRETIENLESFAEWVYLYWNLSDGRNGIKRADDEKREFMTKMFNREIYLIAGVMFRLDTRKKFGIIEVRYMQKFNAKEIEGITFLEKLYQLNKLVYPKVIRIPLAQRDEEAALACKYIRNAFYCAYSGNLIFPENKKQYDKRKRLIGEAISDMYRLDRPMLKLFMVHLFSNDDMEKITQLVNEATRYLLALQASDKDRFSGLD